MEPLLYLTHRIPYPPNKGDKIRSFNLLRFLAKRFSVHLGCFVDSVEDEAHVDELSQWCAGICAVRLKPLRSRFRSLTALATGEALTLAYYRNPELRAWVDSTVVAKGIAKAVAFSSPMAQYLQRWKNVRSVIDLVDVDSAKWTEYAGQHAWPMSAVYRREGRRLLAFERAAIAHAEAGVLVTKAELALFNRLAPGFSAKMHVIENGVDSEFFAQQDRFVSPFPAGEKPVVFTGAMDYWPNVDAVTWFAREVLPGLARVAPQVRFYIVGMNPSRSVEALAADKRVVVTGRVEDVRPYLQHSAVVVAPLRVARGVQNKVLEAMSMERPVVISAAAAAGISGVPGVDFEAAVDAAAFIERTLAALDLRHGTQMGQRARSLICGAYRWDSSLARFITLLEATPRECPAFGAQDVASEAVLNGQG